jgi:hypothetical protein
MSFNGAVAPWGRYRQFHGFQVASQRVGKLSQEPEMRSGRRLGLRQTEGKELPEFSERVSGSAGT